MATKPTRLQERACDLLAEALVTVADAARLDGKGSLDPSAFASIAELAARASSAFDLDTIVARALELRGKTLGLRAGTAELVTLLDPERRPLDLLLLDDDGFRELVARLDEELGEV
jgi:hypothetical protein